jgi:hypothetical protein
MAELRSLDPQWHERLLSTIHLAVYVSLIVVAVLVQGGNAWHYFSRRKHIAAYVESTPTWIVESQRRVG